MHWYASDSTLSALCVVGKVYNGQGVSLAAEYVQFPDRTKIVDLAMAASCTLAVSESGNIYYWGKYQVQPNTYHVCLSVCLFSESLSVIIIIVAVRR